VAAAGTLSHLADKGAIELFKQGRHDTVLERLERPANARRPVPRQRHSGLTEPRIAAARFRIRRLRWRDVAGFADQVPDDAA
jgi:hypothetical protein